MLNSQWFTNLVILSYISCIIHHVLYAILAMKSTCDKELHCSIKYDEAEQSQLHHQRKQSLSSSSEDLENPGKWHFLRRGGYELSNNTWALKGNIMFFPVKNNLMKASRQDNTCNARLLLCLKSSEPPLYLHDQGRRYRVHEYTIVYPW